MPKAPSEQYDQQVEQLAQQYERTALYIAALLATAATSTAALRGTQALVQTALQALLTATVTWIGLQIPIIYRSGVQRLERRVVDHPIGVGDRQYIVFLGVKPGCRILPLVRAANSARLDFYSKQSAFVVGDEVARTVVADGPEDVVPTNEQVCNDYMFRSGPVEIAIGGN